MNTSEVILAIISCGAPISILLGAWRISATLTTLAVQLKTVSEIVRDHEVRLRVQEKLDPHTS